MFIQVTNGDHVGDFSVMSMKSWRASRTPEVQVISRKNQALPEKSRSMIRNIHFRAYIESKIVVVSIFSSDIIILN